jgi:parallel beta-helix repeat protein
MMYRSVAICLSALAFPSSTLAGELNPPAGPVAETGRFGPRIEINAVNTPGDFDSIYKITEPGSYYVSGNITGVVGKSAIEIASSGVTVDLMGFELLGVAGSFRGIHAGLILKNVSISNGSIRSWDDDGIGGNTLANSVLRDLRSVDNGADGLVIGANSLVVGCTSEGNGGHGIVTSGESSVIGNIAMINTGSGIVTGAASTIRENTAAVNTIDGIVAGFGSQVSWNTAALNKADGIEVGSDCLVAFNNCDSNGNAGGDGAGIHATGADNRIDSNNVTDSDRGIDVDGSGNLIIRNSASGNGTYYDIVANNKVGVIVQAPNSAAISGQTGGAGVGTTDPWANISY